MWYQVALVYALFVMPGGDEDGAFPLGRPEPAYFEIAHISPDSSHWTFVVKRGPGALQKRVRDWRIKHKTPDAWRNVYFKAAARDLRAAMTDPSRGQVDEWRPFLDRERQRDGTKKKEARSARLARQAARAAEMAAELRRQDAKFRVEAEQRARKALVKERLAKATPWKSSMDGRKKALRHYDGRFPGNRVPN